MIDTTTRIKAINNHPEKVEKVPFSHIHVQDFFTKEYYAALCQQFEDIKSPGVSEKMTIDRFSRFPGYDAYCWLFPPESTFPLNLFYSQEWRLYFGQLFDIPLTNDVVAEFHHHRVGSKTGFVHNDYNICCFKENYLSNGINPWYYQCSFDPKSIREGDAGILQRMRSIAIIYYLNNEPWQEGDGGETGLYTKADSFSLIKAIPPVSNSILAFEIAPTSYHGFIENPVLERNSIIMWLHTEMDTQLARHNGVEPVPFN